MNLKVSGKLCHGGSVRLAWKGAALRGSAEHLLSAEEASSPLEAKSLSSCHSCKKHLNFGYRVLVRGCMCHTAGTGPQGRSFLLSWSPT